MDLAKAAASFTTSKLTKQQRDKPTEDDRSVSSAAYPNQFNANAQHGEKIAKARRKWWKIGRREEATESEANVSQQDLDSVSQVGADQHWDNPQQDPSGRNSVYGSSGQGYPLSSHPQESQDHQILEEQRNSKEESANENPPIQQPQSVTFVHRRAQITGSEQNLQQPNGRERRPSNQSEPENQSKIYAILNKEREKYRKELESEKWKLEASFKRREQDLSQKLTQAQKMLTDKETTLKRGRSEYEKLGSRFQTLTGDNANLKQELETKNTLIRELEKGLLEAQDKQQNAIDAEEAIREKWLTASSELARLRDAMNQKGDNYFHDEWKSLEDSIRDLAEQHFAGKPSSIHRTYEQQDDLPRLKSFAREPQYYLKGKERRSLIVQAQIWRVLTDYIFDSQSANGKGLYWAAGSQRDCFRNLKELLEPHGRVLTEQDDIEHKRFYKWRAMTSQMLAPHAEKRMLADMVDRLIERTFKCLEGHLTGSNPEEHAKSRLFATSFLGQIYKRAIDLDGEMNQQWAFIYPKTWRSDEDVNMLWGFPLHEGYMELTDPEGMVDPDSPVDLVVCPALVKNGNEFGENYDKEEVLFRGKVVLRHQRVSESKMERLQKAWA